jgi:multiple sugar transport system ATP-binding protein
LVAVTYEHVTKRFEGVTAVRDLQLTVNEGEFLVLLGPSGCGKSTVLRLTAGLEAVTEGNVYLGERRVNDLPPRARDVAMVFQSYALYPHLSVFENLAFGLKVRKTPRGEVEARVRRTADLLDIGALLERKPAQLSGGQRQRVALGRAIVREPRVFLMDEPLSNLDARLRVQTRAELVRLHQQLMTTTIYVTHDQVEAMTMGHRIVVMRDGVVQQVGKPEDVYAEPANVFVAGFIGTPPMNLIAGELRREENGLAFRAGSLSVSLAGIGQAREAGSEPAPVPAEGLVGRDVILGIRPEHIVHPHEARDTTIGAVHGSVRLVEPLGLDALVYVDAEGQDVVARLANRHAPRIGEDVNLAITADRLHLFDAHTEQALRTVN